jgi:glutathione reductase (NADPH)
MGGTCVNVGCVPKKVMFNAATVAEILHDAKQFGFDVTSYKFNWSQLKTARDAYIRRLNGIYIRNLANSNVTVINGMGALAGDHAVTVGTDTYTAKHILIAVGGKPIMPTLPGIEHCIDSNGFFALETQPGSVGVVGGGYIGVELAGVFHALGTKTELITRGDRPLPTFDNLITTTLMNEMKKQGMTFHPNQSPAEIIKDSNGKLTIKTQSGDILGPYDQVLMATGRKANIDKLNLNAADVKLQKSGFIAVNEFQETSTAGVLALGDACGSVQLTPMAIAAGRRLADRLFGNIAGAKADYTDVPTVVFSHPVIGTVGLTEAEAKTKYGDDKIKCYSSTFVNLWYGPWSLEPDQKPKTVMKLVTLLPQEKILGIHMIGNFNL